MKIRFADKALLLKLIPLIIAVFIIIIQLFTLYSTAKLLQIADKETEEYQNTYVTARPMVSQNALYCLYECGGKIGIYDAKSNILVDVIDVFAASLPEADRQALKKGIEIYSFSELSQIIDDFES